MNAMMSRLAERKLLVGALIVLALALTAGVAFASSGSDSPDVSGASIAVPYGDSAIDDSPDASLDDAALDSEDADDLYDDSSDDSLDDSDDELDDSDDRSMIDSSDVYERDDSGYDE